MEAGNKLRNIYIYISKLCLKTMPSEIEENLGKF